jgi:hypothetical protein
VGSHYYWPVSSSRRTRTSTGTYLTVVTFKAYLNNVKNVLPHNKHVLHVSKVNRLMLIREIISVCSENHSKCIYALCGQNIQFCSVVFIYSN